MSARRGFAAMSPDRLRAIASQGGKAAHQQGTAHAWTPAEAKAAGKKGGQARAQQAREREEAALAELERS